MSADDPVYPVFNSEGECFSNINGSERGLTKREHFAAMAPSDIPEWFKRKFPLKYTSNLSEEKERYWKRYEPDDYGYEFHDEGSKAHSKLLSHQGDEELAYSETIYFKWKLYHADALLKELEK